MATAAEMARAELARRELSRRESLKSPVQEQSFLNKLPRNIAAGLTRGAAGMANIPYDIASMASSETNLSPEEMAINEAAGGTMTAPNAERIPHIAERDYSKMFGLTGDPTTADEAIQFASEFGLPIGGAAKVGAKGLKAAGKVIADLPLTRGMAARSLNKAEDLATSRSIANLDIDKDILKDTRQFLPKTTPFKKLLDEASKGGYKSLFTLQSDLGKEARHLSRSASGAERSHGLQAHETRKRLIDAMAKKLTDNGHADIAEMMKHGQNRYRQYNKLEEKIYRPGIKAAKKAGVPVTLSALLGTLYKLSND